MTSVISWRSCFWKRAPPITNRQRSPSSNVATSVATSLLPFVLFHSPLSAASVRRNVRGSPSVTDAMGAPGFRQSHLSECADISSRSSRSAGHKANTRFRGWGSIIHEIDHTYESEAAAGAVGWPMVFHHSHQFTSTAVATPTRRVYVRVNSPDVADTTRICSAVEGSPPLKSVPSSAFTWSRRFWMQGGAAFAGRTRTLLQW